MYNYFWYYTSIYIFETLLIMGLFKSVHNMLDNYNGYNFKLINPTHKKWYVVSNLLKSATLAVANPYCFQIIYKTLNSNAWDKYGLLHLGCIYAGLDMASIIMVPKLAKNTLYHHSIVNILFIYTLTNGMDYYSFSRLISIYAIFSAMACPVNLYLALRIVSENTKGMYYFSSFCFVNYVTCCLFNWSYQIYNLLWTPFFIQTYGYLSVFIFSAFIAIVMWDDIILIKYLKHNSIFKDLASTKKAVEDLGLQLKN